MNKQIREPAVAGLFYPADRLSCDDEVTSLLAANNVDSETGKPKALIVPHAGYVYSGAVAARAYNKIKPFAQKIKRVVVLGPSHRVPLSGLAVSSADCFRTPLGEVMLDRDSISELVQMPEVKEFDLAHQYEHSLEVHLPFLQKTIGEFLLIPVVVGECSPEIVADLLDRFWQQDDTLIVVSTDLSHFRDYDSARIVDAKTSDAIKERQYHLNGEQACGCYALNGLLLEASRANNTVSCIQLVNSGDTAGDKERVVGYGAYEIH